jgi:type II secretory pathway component PulK
MFQASGFNKKGVAALITVLSLGTLVFIISLATAVLAFWSIKNIDVSQKSLKAYYAGYSGIQDALIKLERNKSFNSSFNLSVNESSDVSVSVSNTGAQATITSTAILGQVNKKIQTIVNINSTTGLITPTSTMELTM